MSASINKMQSVQTARQSPRPTPVATEFSWIEAHWPSAGRDLVFLGLYLSLRGYHSLDGDQAYRLPILLHWQDPTLYAADPFVRAFDVFNPHRGWLALIGGLSSVLGLATALLVLFAATFLATCRGIDRLARATWPERAGAVGPIAIALVLIAKAGNIGTNHLFEAMLLDRLVALALGWNALAEIVASPSRGGLRPALLLGLAAFVHPSLGIQIALLVACSWALFAIFQPKTGVGWATGLRFLVGSLIAVVPGLLLNLRTGHLLTDGLPPQDFWNLAVELQSPQHMLPHLWRMPQWLAWGSYLVLAGLALRWDGLRPRARLRLVLILALTLAGLAAGWVGIELIRHTRITVFQPFRMATVARGLAILLIAGHLQGLWERRTWLSRARCLLIVTGLTSDWLMVVVTGVELVTSLVESLLTVLERNDVQLRESSLNRLPGAAFLVSLCVGFGFLSRHDTESGHWTVLAVFAVSLAVAVIHRRLEKRTHGTLSLNLFASRRVVGLAWGLPVLALMAGSLPPDSGLARSPLVRALIARCRFTEAPSDDIERLAIWCREHTPASARFVGPPGPKTFRLWSRRSLAFNRAGSPYHAAGLADWFSRFREHVGIADSPADFVRRYQSARHEVEAGYDRMDSMELAALARRQGADHVITSAPDGRPASSERSLSDNCSLRLLHVEGRYAVYRVEPAS